MANPDLTAEQLFEQMPSFLDASKAAGVTASYLFELSGAQAGTWWVKVENGTATSGKGSIDNPTTTIIADAEDWVKIATGKLNATTAFMSGKLKIKGDMNMALKLQGLFKQP
jgi:putative sterol carrier protein